MSGARHCPLESVGGAPAKPLSPGRVPSRLSTRAWAIWGEGKRDQAGGRQQLERVGGVFAVSVWVCIGKAAAPDPLDIDAGRGTPTTCPELRPRHGSLWQVAAQRLAAHLRGWGAPLHSGQHHFARRFRSYLHTCASVFRKHWEGSRSEDCGLCTPALIPARRHQ